jgi:RNA-directed DNA polymerase
MSAGSYFPPPVKAVEIPKPHGSGTRVLGVPTISDRIAPPELRHALSTIDRHVHTYTDHARPGKAA